MKYTLKALVLFIPVVFMLQCSKDDTPHRQGYSDIQFITVLHTSDEHGWFEATDVSDGASGMMGLWENEFAYNDADSFIVLSGGDMWTGPALSTWFRGQSMVEVMNAMEYDAAAIGNHEFDFTVDTLMARLNTMTFPLLAANIEAKNSGTSTSFARPYLIKKVGDISIGIIGLASQTTPYTAFPEYVEPYNFTDCATAVNKYGAELLSLGVDFNIVLGHFCESEYMDVVSVAKANKVVLVLGGHCHRVNTGVQNNVLFAESGSGFRGCTKINIKYSLSGDSISDINASYVENNSGYSSPIVEDIVQHWQEMADKELLQTIGFLDETIGQSSVEMENMITDSWLWEMPECDVALTNTGGIRQGLFNSNITIADIVGVLPFDNKIYKLELTGSQVLDCLNNFVRAGINTTDGNIMADGSPLDLHKTYKVLTTDYLYQQDAYLFKTYDTSPENTYLNYRDPLINWIKSLNTSTNDPLNNYLDSKARR